MRYRREPHIAQGSFQNLLEFVEGNLAFLRIDRVDALATILLLVYSFKGALIVPQLCNALLFWRGLGLAAARILALLGRSFLSLMF